MLTAATLRPHPQGAGSIIEHSVCWLEETTRLGAPLTNNAPSSRPTSTCRISWLHILRHEVSHLFRNCGPLRARCGGSPESGCRRLPLQVTATKSHRTPETPQRSCPSYLPAKGTRMPTFHEIPFVWLTASCRHHDPATEATCAISQIRLIPRPPLNTLRDMARAPRRSLSSPRLSSPPNSW